MDRRKFLKTSAAGGALIKLGVGAAGCGNPVSPAPLAKIMTSVDANPPVFEPTAATVFDNPLIGNSYGTVQLQVEFYPQLATLGGAITLELGPEIASTTTRGYAVPPNNTILLIHQNDSTDPNVDNFLALQSSYPHTACPLGYNSAKKQIECPCHSSRFFVDQADGQCIGSVAHAPAAAGLQRWKITVDRLPTGTFLIIDLKTGLPCGCENVPAVVSNTLTLPLADFPQLTMIGGVVCGQPMGLANPIIVTRVDASTVIAVDSRCTHLGCTVEWNQQNMDFECPCHGSTFAEDGAVKVGPATVPLTSYPVSVDSVNVVVTITP